MATTVAKLEAVLEADTSRFDRSMDESHSRIGKFAKAAALGLGAAGVAGAVATLKIGWDEWTQSTKVTAQTNAVLKSTGEIAGSRRSMWTTLPRRS
jgi:phage-related minor tail protein